MARPEALASCLVVVLWKPFVNEKAHRRVDYLFSAIPHQPLVLHVGGDAAAKG